MIYEGSRYTKTELYDRNGTLLFKQRSRFSIGFKNAIKHRFTQGERLDALAYKYLGNAQLWWAILDCNPKYRCEVDIPYGAELIIPSYDEVMKCLR